MDSMQLADGLGIEVETEKWKKEKPSSLHTLVTQLWPPEIGMTYYNTHCRMFITVAMPTNFSQSD